MPKKAKELTDRAVRNLKEVGFHSVGGVSGLYLRVQSQTSRSWVLYSTMNGRRRQMGLGPYPEVSLSMARQLAGEKKNEARAGEDPIEKRRKQELSQRLEFQRRTTFSEAVEGYLSIHSKEWKNEKHRKQWSSTLENYAYDYIGDKSVNEITSTDVVKVLSPIWDEKTETATRVRQRMHTIFDWAISENLRDAENPAIWRGRLDKKLANPQKIRKVIHHKSLKYEEASSLAKLLMAQSSQSHKALLFLLLTATRSNEVRGARWPEIDIAKETWVIPLERMKAGKQHTVPLSRQAIGLLNRLDQGSSDYLFPSPTGRQLSDSALSKTLRTMKIDSVPHGLRATFRTWGSEETNHQNFVLEKALAHEIGSQVEAAYRRRDLLEKRRQLMQEWGDYLLR